MRAGGRGQVVMGLRTTLFPLGALLTILSGCATEPIIDVATPASISVRYDDVFVSASEATATAQAHCQNYGKNAEIVERGTMRGGWFTLSFRCVE